MENVKAGDVVTCVEPGDGGLVLGGVYVVERVTEDKAHVWLQGLMGWRRAYRFVLSLDTPQPQENPF